MMEVTDVFNAKVSLDYNDCDNCEFGHIGLTPRYSDEFDNYGDALQAGVDIATRHGGGDIRVEKITRVKKNIVAKGIK